ncbi:MAG: glycosyltransferase family 39 protein [Candidatus Eisenbacteria bacterium]|nr:glycosyltransferase family 39 protein [Candidatus Eisenbacteria bacterium]
MPSRSVAARDATWLFFGSLAIALGLLLANAAVPYDRWPNRSDDCFYYLLLARHAVLHGIVSADGLRPTNGFHPLYFLILRALDPLVGERALPNVALAVLALAHAAAAVILWRTLRRITSEVLAGAIAAIYVANLAVLRIVFAAVETPVMVLCLAAALWAHLRWLERGATRDRAVALIALALAATARTDAVFLGAALALSPALGPARARAWRDVARAVDIAPLVATAIPIVAFGVWGRIATGEFVQTSGRALSFWQSADYWRLLLDALVRFGGSRTTVATLFYGLTIVVQYVIDVARAPFELLARHPVGPLLAVAAIGAWLGARSRAARGAAAATGAAAGLRRTLALFLLLQWAFYAVAFRHGQIWYWHSSLYVAALLVATACDPLRAWLDARAAAIRTPRGVAALALLLALAVTWFTLGPLRPARPIAVSASVAAAPAAPDPLRLVPDGATLGAFDSGRLGWEEPRLVVVNLDGLVNNAAFRALRDRRIGDWMLGQRIEWFYANDVVVRRFAPFGLGAWLDRARPIARSATGVVLYRLR